MKDAFTVALLAIGGLFTLLAAVGIVRMPDVFTRMQAATKAATLGVACVMIAAATFFGDLGTCARALLTTVFVFFTAPVAAHTIGRAAYFVGADLCDGTVVDELRDRYEQDTHRLHSRPARASEKRIAVGTR
jgi:multicomponent Na+:H+ antiporter subunit G